MFTSQKYNWKNKPSLLTMTYGSIFGPPALQEGPMNSGPVDSSVSLYNAVFSAKINKKSDGALFREKFLLCRKLNK